MNVILRASKSDLFKLRLRRLCAIFIKGKHIFAS